MQQIKDVQQILSLIDLTSLNYTDNLDTITTLCNNGITPFGTVAAICIYSHFIPVAKHIFAEQSLYQSTQLNHIIDQSKIKLATVTNFPNGSNDIEVTLFETKLALERGADEVDLVFPYHALIAGDYTIGTQMIKQAKSICCNKILKVIIESGALVTPELIKLASKISIDNGADFIKTSTGKTTISATISAAEIMLTEIKLSNSSCGFKASGGIKTVSEAMLYLTLAKQIMGDNWINQQHFRFGASSLLHDVICTLNNDSLNNKKTSLEGSNGY